MIFAYILYNAKKDKCQLRCAGLPCLKPNFCIEAIIFIIPVAIVLVIEHIGDVHAINEVTGKDYVKDLGFHLAMLATAWSSWQHQSSAYHR